MQCALYIIRSNSNIQGIFLDKIKMFNVVFMHKISTTAAPSMFYPRFQKHTYPTNFSESNYSPPPDNLKKANLDYQ